MVDESWEEKNSDWILLCWAHLKVRRSQGIFIGYGYDWLSQGGTSANGCFWCKNQLVCMRSTGIHSNLNAVALIEVVLRLNMVESLLLVKFGSMSGWIFFLGLMKKIWKTQYLGIFLSNQHCYWLKGRWQDRCQWAKWCPLR